MCEWFSFLLFQPAQAVTQWLRRSPPPLTYLFSLLYSLLDMLQATYMHAIRHFAELHGATVVDNLHSKVTHIVMRPDHLSRLGVIRVRHSHTCIFPTFYVNVHYPSDTLSLCLHSFLRI